MCLRKVAEIRFLREHLLSALRTSGAGRVSSPCHPAPARGCRATSYESLLCVGARDSSLPTPALQSRQRLWARSEAEPAPAHLGASSRTPRGPCASLRLGVIAGTSPYTGGNSLSALIIRQCECVFQQTHRLPWPRSEMPLKRQHRCPGSAGLLQPNRRKLRALLRPPQPEERARYADYQMLAVGRGA